MDFELIAGGSALLIIMAAVQVAKSFGLDPKLAPVVAVIGGILLSAAYTYYGETLAYGAIVTGLVVGLSAVGLYSGSKNTVEKFK